MGALGHGQVGWALGSWSLVVVEVHVVVEVRVEVEVQQQRVVEAQLVVGVVALDEVLAESLRVGSSGAASASSELQAVSASRSGLYKMNTHIRTCRSR